MAGPPPPRPEDDRNIADADWLMGEAKKPKPAPGSAPKGQGSKPPAAGPDDHSYDLIDAPEEAADAVTPPTPPVRPVAPAPRPRKTKEDAPGPEDSGPTATVDQVWSRGAEWGGHMTVVGIAAAIVGFLVYVTFSMGYYLPSFFLMGLGGASLIALCYPFFITLERPVRMTPEQAVKDYFAMLSYLLPHYPRMWLLLSSAGRASREFSSYGEFRSYWKQKLAALQGGKPAGLNPLKFQVESFRSDKSAGQTAVNAKFTVKVFRGTIEPGKEVASYSIASGLVKGPDRMWYLNNGTLPDAPG